jgi:hypothetical protein
MKDKELSMRSKREIFDFLMSLGIGDGTFKRDGYLTTTLRYADRERLTRFGLVTGFGDAFEYRGKGVIVVGHSGVGKTALVRQFATREGCRVLARDELLLYDRDSSGPFQVLRYPYLEANSWSETAARYADFLNSSQGPTLGAVVHLNGEDVFESEAFVEADLYRSLSFFHTLPFQSHTAAWSLLREKLEDVAFLEYAKTYGSLDGEDLTSTFERVSSRLSELLKGGRNSDRARLRV